MSRNTIEIPRDLLEDLYRHNYNPATDYRDPVGTSMWRQVEEILGPLCLCGEDENTDPGKTHPHMTWCPKAEE